MKNIISNRNFKKAAGIILITAVLIVSSTAMGATTKENNSLKTNSDTRDEILLQEDFEGGVVPPAGWTIQKYHSTNNWQIVDSTNYPAYVHTGTYAAAVFWDYIETSDEILTTPEIQITSGAELVQMDFWVYSWTTVYTGATLKVIATIHGQGSGTVLWDMMRDESWDTQEYRQVSIDLTQYTGKAITLSFEYVGIVGPDVGLDDITVFSGKVPAVPIINATMALIQRKGVMTVSLSNVQTLPGGNATDVQWSVHAFGHAIIKTINEIDTGVIPFVAMGSSADCSVDNVTGICAITITITVNAPRAPPFEKTFKGLLLWRLAIIGKSA